MNEYYQESYDKWLEKDPENPRVELIATNAEYLDDETRSDIEFLIKELKYWREEWWSTLMEYHG